MTASARYVRTDRRVCHDSLCLFCGSCYGICKGEPRACRVVTCARCGTDQCMSNGLGNGTCGVCYTGLLPGWSSNSGPCSYARCGKPGVARGKGGKRFVCAAHALQQFGPVSESALKGWTLLPAADVPIL